jgi:hypothetical protein
MAYLGHKSGPKMSVILERYKAELYKLTKEGTVGGMRIRPDVIDHILEDEERSEGRGVVVPVEIPYGYGVKDGELIYINYSHHIQFYYMLTEDEKAQLGCDFKSRRVEILSPGEASLQRRLREQMLGDGERFWGANE